MATSAEVLQLAISRGFLTQEDADGLRDELNGDYDEEDTTSDTTNYRGR